MQEQCRSSCAYLTSVLHGHAALAWAIMHSGTRQGRLVCCWRSCCARSLPGCDAEFVAGLVAEESGAVLAV